MCVVGKQLDFCFSADVTLLFVVQQLVCSSVNEVQCRFGRKINLVGLFSSSISHGGMKTKLRFSVEFQVKWKRFSNNAAA